MGRMKEACYVDNDSVTMIYETCLVCNTSIVFKEVESYYGGSRDVDTKLIKKCRCRRNIY